MGPVATLNLTRNGPRQQVFAMPPGGAAKRPCSFICGTGWEADGRAGEAPSRALLPSTPIFSKCGRPASLEVSAALGSGKSHPSKPFRCGPHAGTRCSQELAGYCLPLARSHSGCRDQTTRTCQTSQRLRCPLSPGVWAAFRAALGMLPEQRLLALLLQIRPATAC